MNVALWAEIRRLAEIERLSGRAISRRLHCSWRTVVAALAMDQPPAGRVRHRGSLLDAYNAKIATLVAKSPELSAVRVHEEISRGPDGYIDAVGSNPPQQDSIPQTGRESVSVRQTASGPA
jgi:hypothetical protein